MMRHRDRRRKLPPPTPVDKGYAWVILGASSVIHMLVIGNLRTFSIIYTECLEYFQTGASNTAWMYSLFSGLLLGSSPVANYLCKTYTYLTTAIMGGVLLTVGYLSSAFVKNMVQMCVTAGVIAGLGSGLCYTASLKLIDHYFKRRRLLANTVLLASAGAGNLILPYIYRVLSDKYGILGCMMVMGGILFNVCVPAALLRQPVSKRIKQYKPRAKQRPPVSAFRKASIFSSQPLLPDIVANKNSVPFQQDTPMVNYFDDLNETSLRKKVLLVNLHKQETEKPLSFIDRPKTALRRMSSCPSLAASVAYSTSNLNFLKKPKLAKIEEEEEEMNVDWKIEQKFMFGVCAVAVTVMYIGYSLAYLSIGAHAHDLGFSKLGVALVVSLTGVGELLSAVICGFIALKEIMQLKYILSLCTGVLGIVCFLMFFIHELIGMCCYALVLGLFGGSIFSLFPKVLLDSVGRWELPNAMVFISLFMAAGTLFFSPFAGWLRDFTGSWIVTYYFIGGVVMIGALILITLEPVARRCRNKWSGDRDSISF